MVFKDQEGGQPKIRLGELLYYPQNFLKAYGCRFPAALQFFKFCIVGASGFIVDTTALVAFVEILSFDPRLAACFVFFLAVTWNYVFNRRWTFARGRHSRLFHSYIAFVITCLFGLGIRIGVMHLLIEYAGMGKSPWYIFASFAGIIAATVFNFTGSKYIAFSKTFSR